MGPFLKPQGSFLSARVYNRLRITQPIGTRFNANVIMAVGGLGSTVIWLHLQRFLFVPYFLYVCTAIGVLKIIAGLKCFFCSGERCTSISG